MKLLWFFFFFGTTIVVFCYVPLAILKKKKHLKFFPNCDNLIRLDIIRHLCEEIRCVYYCTFGFLPELYYI